jgi:flagellar assembly factor FliW
MKVETTRFGVVDVDESTLITMPSGPLGFENSTRFCLIQPRAGASFRWLQSIEEPALAFVVVDPSEYFTDYEIEIGESDVQKLQLTSEEDALVLAILTIRDNGHSVSANLAAPIVVNSKNLTGAQIVLEDERYNARHALVGTHAQQTTAARAA